MDPCILLFLDIVLIIFMLYKKIPLWIIFLVIGFITSLSMGGFDLLYKIFFRVLVDSNTWDLVIIMFLISVFVSLYRVSGFVEKLGEELALILQKPRLITTTVPAVLGLLPVPGGALMSIPIVDRVGKYIGLSPLQKLFVNVWFRHVIFIVYPLSTVLVMTAVLTGVDLWDLIIRQLPIALFMIIIGYILGFQYTKDIDEKNLSIHGSSNKRVLYKTLTPILVTVVIAITLSPLLDYRFKLFVNRLSMIIGVVTGIVLLVILANTDIGKLGNIIISREVLELVFIGFTAMFLRVVFSSIDLSCITSYVRVSNPLLLAIIIPVFFSLLAGIVSSSVALSISILSGITSFTPEIASLIYISAFMGYLGSPLHLCYIYTAEYLKIPIVKGYKYMLPAIILTLSFTILLYIVLW